MLDDTTPKLQTYYYPCEEEPGEDDIKPNKKIGNKGHSVWGGNGCSKSMICPNNNDQEESFGLQSIFGTIDRIDQIFKHYWRPQNEEEDRGEMMATTTNQYEEDDGDDNETI